MEYKKIQNFNLYIEIFIKKLLYKVFKIFIFSN